MSLLVQSATMFISQTYRRIDPYYFGCKKRGQNREIIHPNGNDEDPDGVHLIVHYNDIFEDIQGRLFRVIDFLGCGSYSLVYKCEYVNTPGRFIAVKISKNVPRLQQRLENEAKLLQKLNSFPDIPGRKLIPEYVSFFPISGHSCLAIGLYQRTLLERFSFINDTAGLLLFIKCVMKQILLGLDFIHQAGFVHGDLKPDNIMLVRDDAYDIKFIDFGSATPIDSDMPRIPQPLCYRSPELIIGSKWNEKVDIWSAGCIAVELILGFPIFACETEEDVLGMITKLIGPIPQSMIVGSLYWKQFYVTTPRGFMLLKDLIICITKGHLMPERFDGIDESKLTLEMLIRNRIQNDVNKQIVDSMISFIYGLLNIDSTKRWNIKEALSHCFLTEEFNEQTVNWTSKNRSAYLACSSHGMIPNMLTIESEDNNFVIPHSINSIFY
ncbi:CMGC family protein kinase [Tritrichomonas foetus]|uniref:CMGC family protein kinase n=1 Tax=Tritrichomonas foetus TaxID=1144522 RepID=A0A1J4KSW0_9EUKA|nr:CMGC family protein kinase [Tritrichomonas foetus]|eukprot:OHT14194.1 CMGC family protein kinase [Tritrichomonas foetus]